MQKLLVVSMGMCLFAAQLAVAQTSADVELLSAQKAYQEALRDNQGFQTELLGKQQALAAAKKRLVELQNNITQLESEINTLQSSKTNADQTISAAGLRLDAAWRAAGK